MAELDINKTTTTDLTGNVSNITVNSVVPDQENVAGESYYEWSDAADNLGFYQEIPEIKSALRVLGQRVAGIGWTTPDSRSEVELDHITGWGKDTFTSIMVQMVIEKKVFGDSFAEIIRTKEGKLLNLKKLYAGNMRVVLNDQGLIKRYEQVNHISKKTTKFQTQDILHLCNDRIANEIHGTSIITSLKAIIEAKKEALSDERKIRHRELAQGVLEVDTDNTTELATIINKYQTAVNKGEVLALQRGVAELKDNPNQPRDRIQWLTYLDNLFYQIIGTPKVLVTSEGYTEAGGKAGLIAFEPTEIAEKLQLEEDLWNQLAKQIQFTKSPSILDARESSQNAGQTGVQQNELNIGPTRTE